MKLYLLSLTQLPAESHINHACSIECILKLWWILPCISQ